MRSTPIRSFWENCQWAQESGRAHLGLQDFELILKSEWGSEHLNFRQQIRQSILDTYSTDETVLDLEQKPEIAGRSLSISHNRLNGGFATSTQAESLGFDIEVTARLDARNTKRFSVHDEEIQSAPSGAALWTAKEAAFKSLPKKAQPYVVGEIEIGEWVCIEQNLFICRMLKVKDRELKPAVVTSKGLVIQWEDQTLAFFTTSGMENALAIDR